MDLAMFHEFTELVRHESYTSAAKALNMSQPTLSRHVEALERELNAQLVASVLPVRLTAAGEAVFQSATRMGDVYEALQEDLASLRHVDEERIRVHDAPELEPIAAMVIEAANRLAQERPHVKLAYTSLRAGAAPADAVASLACDLAFEQVIIDERGGEAPEPLAEVESRPLPQTTSRVLVGVPTRSPFAQAPELRLADLRHESFLMRASRTSESLGRSFASACRARGFRPGMTMSLCRANEEFYLLDQGDGLHLLSEWDLKANVSLACNLAQHRVLVPIASDERVSLQWRALFRAEHAAPLARFLDLLTASENDAGANLTPCGAAPRAARA